MRRSALASLALLTVVAAALTGCADEGEVRDGVTIKSNSRPASLWDNR